jgi:hypothetical protein
VSVGPLAMEGAAVSAGPLAIEGPAVSPGPLAAEGAAVSAALLAAAGVAAGPLAVGGMVFGAPFWAARRISISLKNASHVGDSSIR